MARWKTRNPIRVVDPLVRTVKQPYARFPEDGMVPGWDKIPGMSQHAARVSLKDRPSFETRDDHPAVPDKHPKS